MVTLKLEINIEKKKKTLNNIFFKFWVYWTARRWKKIRIKNNFFEKNNFWIFFNL